jgi:pimeloyl-ACP methyl ester carboxylesterase
LERSSEDAAILLRELGAPRARIVGWGMGAVISLALAAQHEVAQLVLVEPLLHAKKQLRLRLVMAAALGMAKVGLQRRAAKRYLRFVFGQGLDDERHSAFDELDEPTRKRLLASPRTVLAEIESGTGEELTRTALARIRCSAGVVVGEGSAPFLQEAADRTARALGGRVERVVKGDHASTYRRPEALVATLRAALQEAPRAGAK